MAPASQILDARLICVTVVHFILRGIETEFCSISKFPTWIVWFYYSIFHHHHHHQSVLPKGRSFTVNSRTKTAVLPKDRSSTANFRTKVAILQGMNRGDSFPLPYALHFLFSMWMDLKRSEKIPSAPYWRWGVWFWLTGPSGLHRNSPQELNIGSIRVFDQIGDPEIAYSRFWK